MGVPTQGQIQNITDVETAELDAILTGALNCGTGKVSSTVADYLLAAGDPDLLVRILDEALNRDEQLLPENSEDLFRKLASMPDTSLWLRALAAAVIAEGAYASFDAYLTNKGATVQALWMEAYSYLAGETLTAANVLSPLYQMRIADRVYTGADAALSDDTTDAGDADAADVAVFAEDNYCLYVGSRWKFNRLCIGYSTNANISITPTFQYWNGTAWTTLTATDNSVGCTLDQPITWTAPTDWEPCNEDGGGTAFTDTSRMYYVRIQRTQNDPLTDPVASMIHIAPAAVLNSSGAHFGVRQGPLGLLRITGVNTISAESLNTVASSRWYGPALRLKALNALGADAEITATNYTDEAGNPQTTAQTNWVSPAAGDTKVFALAGSGARSIGTTGWTVTSTGNGMIAVETVLTRTPAI